MTATSIDSIIVYGSGLAGYMCATALAHILPSTINITLVTPAEDCPTDIFYGNVTGPTFYSFLHSIGVSEPELLTDGNTSFSFGTQYHAWGGTSQPWVQSYHLPLNPINGVGFHHFITRQHAKGIAAFDLEPYLISSQAALEGTFAHPPVKQNIPLARAENGYHFSPGSWLRIFESHVEKSRVRHIMAKATNVKIERDNISSLTLDNGETLTADFFVDGSGPNAELISHVCSRKQSGRKLCAITDEIKKEKLTGVCRALTGTDYGWHANTPLQDAETKLTVFHPSEETAALKTHGPTDNTPVEFTLGHREQAWIGNCVAVGQAANVVEPLTPAPMMLLQRDIERLLELIPVTLNMRVECREYNRRFNADYVHAMLFHRAFFEGPNPPDTPYFGAVRAELMPEKLKGKLAQFENRGILVQYDNEVFNTEDWTILHYGMGRIPKRYDPLADRVPEVQIEKTFLQMRTAIKQMAKRMPPHQDYMTRLLAYLKENHAK